jgi:tetratricopeptide (TPR) repeat protein
VLSTLWLVDDWATSDVMEGFYKRLLRATPRGVALYRAKRDTYARHPDRPDLWAAFVLAGDPDELARYRLLAPPSSQFVERPAVKEGGVTYLDTSRRLFTSFEVPDVPVEGRPLRVASISVRNLARGIAEDKRDEAMRSFDEGRYEDAANGLLEALEGLDESSAAAQQLIAKLHRDAAIAFGYLGDLQRSLEHGLAALALYAALEDWPLEMGQVLDNIAAVEVGLGRTEDARDHYEQALAIKREERPGGHPSIDFTVERLMELGGSPPPGGDAPTPGPAR